MKNLLFALIILLFTSSLHSQNQEIPLHLFLGTWVYGTAADTTTEYWETKWVDEYSGKTIFANGSGSFMAETMRLVYKDGVLNYCATVLEQDPDKPQGEICFALTSYKDYVFTFENPKHDFPKKITYDFSDYRRCTARVEGDGKSFDFEYVKTYDFASLYELRGKIVKEQFVNKGGKTIEGMYDYYFETEGIKYFIKIKSSKVTKDILDSFAGLKVFATVRFQDGLWDSDDGRMQSRVGKYVTVSRITPVRK